MAPPAQAPRERAPQVAPPGTVRKGLWLSAGLVDLAKSSYVADLTTVPAQKRTGSLAAWVSQALEAHARRSPRARAKLAERTQQQLAGEARAPGHIKSRSFFLTERSVQLAHEAMACDLREIERAESMSAFTQAAIVAAADTSRKRYRAETGRDRLPPAPARLPRVY